MQKGPSKVQTKKGFDIQNMQNTSWKEPFCLSVYSSIICTHSSRSPFFHRRLLAPNPPPPPPRHAFTYPPPPSQFRDFPLPPCLLPSDDDDQNFSHTAGNVNATMTLLPLQQPGGHVVRIRIRICCVHGRMTLQFAAGARGERALKSPPPPISRRRKEKKRK